MRLIGSPASPFVQRCVIVARAKGHQLPIDPPPGGSMQSPEFQAMSPMGRIPLLSLEDGDCICESAAIIAFLDEVLDGPSLIPGTPRQKARIREIEAISVGEIAAGIRPVMVHRVFGYGENEPVVEAGIAQADRGIRALQKMIGDDGFATGGQLTRADAALVPFITLMTIVSAVPEIADLLSRHPFLLGYREGAAARSDILAQSISNMTEGFAMILERQRQASPSSR